VARFQVFAVWAVENGKVARGGEVLRRAGVRGLRFSFYDGARLTVLADVRAASPDDAVALVVGRATIGWQTLAGTPLGSPEYWQALPASGLAGVPAGLAPRRRDARDVVLRGGVADWRAPWRGTEPPWLPPAGLDSDDDPWDEDPPDDGGLAGVREPRRPRPGPGHLTTEASLPSAARAG